VKVALCEAAVSIRFWAKIGLSTQGQFDYSPPPLLTSQHDSAMTRKRKRHDDVQSNNPSAKNKHPDPVLPAGVFHYNSVAEVPWDTQQ